MQNKEILEALRTNTEEETHKYSFVIIHLKTMGCLMTKFKTNINHPLLNIYEHYYRKQ